MSVQSGGGIDGYSRGVGSANIQADPKSILQDKLFSRVAELLDRAGIQIEGSGSLALDLDENGNIEVIGNISNKEEVASALDGDPQLSALLSSGLAKQNATDASSSGWSQDAYILEISQEALERCAAERGEAPEANESVAELRTDAGVLTRKFEKYSVEFSHTEIEPITYDSSKPWITITQTGRGGQYDNRYGENPNNYSVPEFDSIPIGKKFDLQTNPYEPRTPEGYVLENGNEYMTSSGKLLTLFGLGPVENSFIKGPEGPEVMKETRAKIHEHLKAEKAAVFDEINSILTRKGLTLDDDENIEITVDDAGKIIVEGNSGKAKQIEQVLNEEGGEDLAKKLKTIALKEAAFSSYLNKDIRTGMSDRGNANYIDEKIALALLEDKTGLNAEDMYNATGQPDMKNSVLAELNEKYPGVAYSVLSAAKGMEATEVDVKFSLSNEGLSGSLEGEIAGKSEDSAVNQTKRTISHLNEAHNKAGSPGSNITAFSYTVSADGESTFLSGTYADGSAMDSPTVLMNMLADMDGGVAPHMGRGREFGLTKDIAEQMINEYLKENKYAVADNLVVKATYENGNASLEVVERKPQDGTLADLVTTKAEGGVLDKSDGDDSVLKMEAEQLRANLAVTERAQHEIDRSMLDVIDSALEFSENNEKGQETNKRYS